MRKVLIYTTHKAASMFLHELTAEVSGGIKVDYYSVNYDQHYNSIKELSWKKFIEIQPAPGCFGPIRAGVAEPLFPECLEMYSIVLHLRDPRDVLTSLFFSQTYSHVRHVDVFNPSDEVIKRWETDGIDKFVIAKSTDFKRRYQSLISNLIGKDNVVLLRYEDMIIDYEKWLKGFLSAFFDYSIIESKKNCDRIHQRLFKKHRGDFTVLSEDVFKHKRQILPGDYRRKLQLETIEKLNLEFSNILKILGYAETGC